MPPVCHPVISSDTPNEALMIGSQPSTDREVETAMSVMLFRRHPRTSGPDLPEGELNLQEPPALPERQTNMSSLFVYLPMAITSAAMVLMFRAGSLNSTTMYLVAGMLVVATVGSLVGQLVRSASERKQRIGGNRRDYLRYLTQTRRRIRQVVAQQRDAYLWLHPEPASLWSVVHSTRLWERRVAHGDFGEVRLALGEQRLTMRLNPLSTKPVEDLEPLSAHALRRFIRAYGTVADQPIAVFLRGYARVLFDGDPQVTRGLVRALVAQLVTFHAPDDLRLAVCAADERRSDWEWVKWLPHAMHPTLTDAAGPVRLMATSLSELERMFGTEVKDRARFTPGLSQNDLPYHVVIVDGDARPAGQPSTISNQCFAYSAA